MSGTRCWRSIFSLQLFVRKTKAWPLPTHLKGLRSKELMKSELVYTYSDQEGQTLLR